MSDFLEELPPRDRARLLALARTVHVKPGGWLVRRGEWSSELYRLVEGTLEIVDARSQPPVILNVIMKGGVVGEISFVMQDVRSADVRAPEGAICQCWDRRLLEQLLIDDPALSAHIYRAMAQSMARRLRDTSGGVAVAARPRLQGQTHLAGQELGRALSAQMVEVEPLLRRDREAGRAEVMGLLQRLGQGLRELVQGLPDASAMEAGSSLASELHPFMMRSHLGELLMDRARGVTDIQDHVDQGVPKGDGPFGELIDLWLLQQPTLRAFRERRAELMERILDVLPPVPPRAMVVGGTVGLIREMIPALSRIGGELTLVEDRAEVLERFQQSAQRPVTGLSASLSASRDFRLRLERMEAIPLITGTARIAHLPLHFVVLDGYLDALPVQWVDRLLVWVRRQLAPGGRILLSAMGHSPDDLLVRHLLGWPICRYTPDGLKRLLESAGFVAPSIVSDRATGTGLIATATARIKGADLTSEGTFDTTSESTSDRPA